MKEYHRYNSLKQLNYCSEIENRRHWYLTVPHILIAIHQVLNYAVTWNSHHIKESSLWGRTWTVRLRKSAYCSFFVLADRAFASERRARMEVIQNTLVLLVCLWFSKRRNYQQIKIKILYWLTMNVTQDPIIKRKMAVPDSARALYCPSRYKEY